jgi:hypothetical protein
MKSMKHINSCKLCKNKDLHSGSRHCRLHVNAACAQIENARLPRPRCLTVNAANGRACRLFVLGKFLLWRGLARRVRRPWRLVYQSNSRAVGRINSIGRTCPRPNSVAPRVVFHTPAGTVLLASEIRAPHFYRINHCPTHLCPRYSLFEPKTRRGDYLPTWSQYPTVRA